MLKRREKAHKPKRRKDKFFLVFLFVLSISNALAQTPSPNSEGVLSSIEERIFYEQYPSEKREDRVSRIEEFLFGVKSNKPYEERLNKIVDSLKTKDPSPIRPVADLTPDSHLPSIDAPTQSPRGVLDTISSIEKKVLGRPYGDLSFQARVDQLEEKMLSRSEVVNSKNKPLLERVTVLVKRAGIEVTQDQPQILPPNSFNESRSKQQFETIKPNTKQNSYMASKSYRIDPNTGEIINELTGEVVKDASGNPIQVKIPTQLPLDPFGGNYPQLNRNQFSQQNQNSFPNQLPNNPYGFGGPGANPLDLLYNQNNLDPGY